VVVVVVIMGEDYDNDDYPSLVAHPHLLLEF